MKVGIFLGRAIPFLHPGHLWLMEKILRENDLMIACIGSAQLTEPFAIEERRAHWQRQLGMLFPNKKFVICEIVDPNPIDTWPDDMVRACGIKASDQNTFYRSDPLDPKYTRRLKELGTDVRRVKRKSFLFMAPDGYYRRISSGTEVRMILEHVKPKEVSRVGKR